MSILYVLTYRPSKFSSGVRGLLEVLSLAILISKCDAPFPPSLLLIFKTFRLFYSYSIRQASQPLQRTYTRPCALPWFPCGWCEFGWFCNLWSQSSGGTVNLSWPYTPPPHTHTYTYSTHTHTYSLLSPKFPLFLMSVKFLMPQILFSIYECQGLTVEQLVSVFSSSYTKLFDSIGPVRH